MAKQNGHAKLSNRPPVLYEVQGNVAAMICQECGKPYVVSAYSDRQFAAHWQGWRVCPHCHRTEGSVWWAGWTDEHLSKPRAVYEASQRVLSARERAEVMKSEPTRIKGALRLTRVRRDVSGNPEKWN